MELKNKLKKIIKNEEKFEQIINFLFWELSNVQGRTPQITERKLRLLLKYLSKSE